jgi:hypothetical protein
MDRFIAAMPSEEDGELNLCLEHGVAYQRDMANLVAYDAEYYDRYTSYEGQEIAQKINAGRVAMVGRHLGRNRVCDVGIGSGEFIKSRENTYGFDVNPVAIEWLKRNDLWLVSFDYFSAFTFWDVIEHCPTPEDYLKQVPLHGWAFFSIPVFDDLRRIRESKHYRPNEHLYYYTRDGFVSWLEAHGLKLMEESDFETLAGRESIRSFAFKRWAWR